MILNTERKKEEVTLDFYIQQKPTDILTYGNILVVIGQDI